MNKLSNEIGDYIETICEMMSVQTHIALSINVLLQASRRLPFNTSLTYDHLNGRWIFSSCEDDDFIPDGIRGFHVSGPNFTFCDMSPDMAIARGIHYYYHLKIKD